MSLDKVLGGIQSRINELTPVLELFVEESIQPSVKDCENLQYQLNKLQESLAVYKFNKQEREISPSFNIHAKVSNTEIISNEKKEEVAEIIKEEIISNTTESVPVKSETTENTKIKSPLTIAINDKFRFINELFNQNSGEYHVAIEQIGNLNTSEESEIYLNSLKTLYGWKENSEAVKYFYSLVKKRFD